MYGHESGTRAGKGEAGEEGDAEEGRTANRISRWRCESVEP
jgi:hypothetical protein